LNGYEGGRWTDDEHDRFLEALEKFGKDWLKIEEHIGTRSSA
jgi:SHAQKYF class myb-like DNA-binding protein